MPRRGEAVARADTKLAELRAASGHTQDEMARAVGLSIATYRRLEQGKNANPPLRYLANCAIALGVKVEDLIEPDWREWAVLDERASVPPDWLA